MDAVNADLITWLERLRAESVRHGWNPQEFEGRITEDQPAWDFDEISRDALREATSAVDVGVRDGSRLLSHLATLGSARPMIIATEGWPEDRDFASTALALEGVEVVSYDPELGDRMPLNDAAYDLVLNRHEVVDAAELARVLRPGGVVLTQQIDALDGHEIRDWFDGDNMYEHVTLERFVAAFEAEGFAIERADEWLGYTHFRDVSTLVEYLAVVPGDLDDFTVKGNEAALDRLAHIRPIDVSLRRFIIRAVKRL